MRVLQLSAVLIVLVCGVSLATAKVSPEEAAKVLPNEIGGFRRVSAVRPNKPSIGTGGPTIGIVPVPIDPARFSGAEAEYVAVDGERFVVELIRVERDSDAYSLLTLLAQHARDAGQSYDAKITREIATTSFALPGRVVFFKGRSLVSIYNAGSDSQTLVTFAKVFADSLDKGEGDVPILVKHLPQWETSQTNVVYLAGFRSLRELVPNQPVLEAITSEGDADAVRAAYGTAQFLLIEFNTPQLAGDNDRAITAKLNELRQQGQPVPTSYRKVGNYSVFVFNAASEAEANNLIDQVEYAQMVTWLGNNPYLLEQAQKEYYETTAGVLVAVVLASGLSLLVCFGLGGLIGAVLFSRRRAQQRAAEAYSDAGGMLRLNLDDITPQSDPAKLLGP